MFTYFCLNSWKYPCIFWHLTIIAWVNVIMVGKSGNTNLPILKCMSWQFLEFTLPLKISLDFNKSCELLRDLFKYGNLSKNRKKTFTHVIVTYCFSFSRWKVFNGKNVISWVYKVFGFVKIIELCKQIFSMVYPLEDKRDQMSKKMLCSCVCEKLTFLLHFLFISMKLRGLLEYPQCPRQQHDYNLSLTFCYRSTYHHVCYRVMKTCIEMHIGQHCNIKKYWSSLCWSCSTDPYLSNYMC